jgi:hypothetical protein
VKPVSGEIHSLGDTLLEEGRKVMTSDTDGKVVTR